MRIIEVRDGFIKFESKERISLSSFIQILGEDKTYIAQVIQVKISGENCIIYAKILFLYDGTLRSYDKTLPDKNAEISEFTFDILSNSLDYQTPIVAGRFIGGDIDIPIDKECFNKKMLVCVDRVDSNNLLISNFKRQFAHLGKVLVIDMLGIINSEKYIAGRDFSLPLNTEALSFMYEDCLNDATKESKDLIKEIFRDLAEYSRTVPFVPFGALKSIVDEMVDKSHVFKLLVLKNKLAKFDSAGCFARTPKEAENLKHILESDFAVIDLSTLDPIFQNRYLSCIYSAIEKQAQPVQVFLESSNAINKRNIKNALTNPNISTTFITHSKFKYINEIKNLFDNFIIEPSFTANEVFSVYNSFLNAMPNNTYLLVGEGTNYIPLVSTMTMINTVIKPESSEEPLTPNEDGDTDNETNDEIAAQESDENDMEPIPENIENQIQEPDEETVENTGTDLVSEDIEEKSEQEAELIDVSEPAEEAIEKKSEILIEKFSEEVENKPAPAVLNIFNDEEDLEETSNEAVENTSSQEEVFITETPQESEIQEEPIPEQAEDSQILENNTETINIEPAPEAPPLEETLQESETEDDLEIKLETEPIELTEVQAEDSLEMDLGLEPENTNIEEISIPEEISELAEIAEENEDEPAQEIPALEEYEESLPEINIIPLSGDNNDFEELEELNPDEASDEDAILVDLGEMDEDEITEPVSEEELDKQIVADVDKVFTTMKEEDISDSDLDFIDELNEENNTDSLEELSTNGGFEELQPVDEEDEDDGFLQPLEEAGNSSQDKSDSGEILETKNTSTPIVPVYEADIPPEDLVSSDDIEQGDTVTHAKYGSGVVEKMIKYGTKTLYSINFDNIGRRLLDPTLTEIKKS